MEVGESSANRRRTESSGGSSDSELSEGWNYVDELDVINQGPSSRPASRQQSEKNDRSSDLELSEGWNYVGLADVSHRSPPSSSDGESVEIIEAEDEPPQNDLELEQKATQAEEAVEIINEPEPLNDTEPSITKHGANLRHARSRSQPQRVAVPASIREYPAMRRHDFVLPPHEEMFDSSFCWFLLISAFVVLFSNLAYMAAENVLGWNTNMLPSSSLLRDLPVTKPSQQESFPNHYSWEDSVDVVVDSLDDTVSDMEYDAEIVEITDSFKGDGTDNQKHSKQSSKWISKIDSLEIGRYFKLLRDVSRSAEAQNKFAQTMLILDTIYISLRNLEEVVTENPELYKFLKRQQSKLHDVITEVEIGVERSVSKLSSNVLNKVRKLERKFENQLCKMEKNGYKDKLKHLLYNCEEEDEDDDSNVTGKNQETDKNLNFVETRNGKKQMSIDNFQYEVDKDSTGKEYSKPSTDSKESDEYYKLLKSGKDFNTKFIKQYNNPNSGRNMDKSKAEFKDWNDGAHHHRKSSIRKIPIDKEYTTKPVVEKSVANIVINYLKELCAENLKTQKTNDYREIKNNIEEIIMVPEKFFNAVFMEYCRPRSSDPTVDESALEVDKYLREHCEENQKTGKTNDYRELKDGFRSKRLIPKELFDAMYTKYCLQSHDNLTNRSVADMVKKYLRDTCEKNLKTKKANNYEELKNNIDKKGKISKEMFDDLYKQNCKTVMDKSTVQLVTKYLRHNCQKNVKPHQIGKQFNDYQKLKNYIDHRVNIPKESFDELYQQFCRQNYESLTIDKTTVEAVSRYLKENCQKNINSHKMAKHSIDYHKVKDYIDRKVRITKELFDSLFEKYCKPNDSSFKSDSSFKKENWKGDYSRKNKKTGFLVMKGHNANLKNIVEINILDSSDDDNLSDSTESKVIEPDNKRHPWTFSYKESSSDNKTNTNGYWFIKAGESRSRIRWLHRRSDWWFERASHRRSHPHFFGFHEKFKNWYFGRVWARLHCRQNPHDSSCNFPQDETITIPNSSSNPR